jgi:NTE family protein
VRTDLRLDHVLASAAIPIVFPAIKLEDGFYGDGSVRQTAPLAPAIHLGARRLIAISMRVPPEPIGPSVPIGDYPAAAEVVSLLFNAVFLDSIDADAERLDRVNQLVAALPSGSNAPAGLRKVELLLLRPSRDLGLLAKGHETKLPYLVRMVVQGMGGRRARASDLVSYLSFEPSYTETLMDLGYSDASGQWPRIEEFLTGGES